MSASIGSTFHSFAYGLIRRYSPTDLYVGPLRLLSAPEQDVVLRELLTDHPESVRWPDGAARTRSAPAASPARSTRCCPGPGRRGSTARRCSGSARTNGLPEFVAAGAFLEQYLTILDDRGAVDYADLIRRATIEATVHRDELRAEFAHVFVDEYQDTDPGQVALLRAIAGDGRNLVAVGDPHQSIYAFRGAEVRGILDFPDRLPARRRRARRRGRAGARSGGSVRGSSPPPSGSPSGSGCPAASPSPRARRSCAPRAAAGAHGAGPRRGAHLRQRPGRGRAPRRPAAARAPRGRHRRGTRWRCWCAPGRPSIPPLRRSLGAAGVPVEVASDEVPLVRDPAALPLIDAMRVVLNLDNDDPDHVDHIDAGSGRGAADRSARRPRRRRRTPPGPAAAPAREGVRPTPRSGCRPTRGSWSGGPCSTPRRSTG